MSFFSKNKRRAVSKSKGFTVFEVAVAVVVLGTALAAIAQMLNLGMRLNEADTKRVTALSLLEEKMAKLKVKGFSGVVPEARTQLASDPEYEMETIVHDIDFNLKKVKVIIYWKGDPEETAAESAKCLVVDSTLPVEIYQ